MSDDLEFGRADDEPHTCLIGKRGALFARVVGSPDIDEVYYARLFAASERLLRACDLAAVSIELATKMGVQSHGLVAAHKELCAAIAAAKRDDMRVST